MSLYANHPKFIHNALQYWLVSKVSPFLFVISFLLLPRPEKKKKKKTEVVMQEAEKKKRSQEKED